ncbi:hypothetical protein CKAH01_09374 [Colletotrichum kahawae]|uniref:Secreted protein n=1 Tax=Colletotrichum kahawae TaxID=34407 RepID=A0AAD9Y027_COLKA|nr:hypothetical protein CKAH01_09374 [Colletotrichum kahawae]
MRDGNITLILALLNFVLRYRRGASHVQCPCQISAIVGHLLQATTMEQQSRQHHHTDSLGKTVRHEQCSAFASFRCQLRPLDWYYVHHLNRSECLTIRVRHAGQSTLLPGCMPKTYRPNKEKSPPVPGPERVDVYMR